MSGDNNYLKTISAQLNGVQATVNILRQDLSLANTKLDAANRRLLRLETLIKGGDQEACRLEIREQAPPGEDLNRIPEDLRIEETIVSALKSEANNPGHFTCLLLKKMFAGLFLTGQRSEYNWFGGGQKGKKDLDARKKKAIEIYVVHYYHEVKNTAAWRDRVVARIN
ncbi:uncharacterized protein LOC125661000 [Ostrea edulis]|uniref:uncharacterized protein LOC125661000 n=1 Tax=Ostrea edulis TaxID=37623 RepID=UPI0024AF9189|nr:uncharacterized protein LOC125661000 [Ostrea edulis]